MSAARIGLAALAGAILLSDCVSAPQNDTGLTVVTPAPTIDSSSVEALCAAIDRTWAVDWPAALRALHELESLNASCEGFPDTSDQLYRAYVAYGDVLAGEERAAEAIRAYQRALDYDPAGQEANAALAALGSITPTPPAPCDQATVQAAIDALPPYRPVQGSYIRVEQGGFRLFGSVWPVYGVNYYPRDYPDRRFLTEMVVNSVALELDLMTASGINTLRIALRHEDLFTCPGSGAVPIASAFERLDAFIQSASVRGFRLILVLNHEAELSEYPVVESPHILEQMAFIAGRYRLEPGVMAYDLRAGGDRDYAAGGSVDQAAVLSWLADAAALIRRNAPDHLVTAGWFDQAEFTAPIVDFVSFQHTGEIMGLRQTIAVLTDQTDLPILLASVGFDTYFLTEDQQALAYQQVFDAVSANDLAGWVVTTAFDYPLEVACIEPDCPAAPGPANRAGLWTTSYIPKRSVDAVELITGVGIGSR
jgi:hypothetical protein